MRISRVHIKNFRGLEDVEIRFEPVTTFLGPNGAGKSSILRSLDWFFNGTKTTVLSSEDVYLGDGGRVVTVEVEFDQLTESDRAHLGKYASPTSDSVTIWKQWNDGVEKIFGRGRTFPPFDLVRAGESAAARKAEWQELREREPTLELPAWSNDAAVTQIMMQWEDAHPSELAETDVESTTHFFGFAGQAVMSGLFDFIFVSADLRVAEEATDARTAVIGRILEQAVDRTGAEAEMDLLIEAFGTTQAEVHDRHFSSQLEALSDELTAAVSEFAVGRQVSVTAQAEPVKPVRTQFGVTVFDAELETRVERQGHGFQRALLIAALRMLAQRGRQDPGEGVICLAVEEPELYQHPLQARSFAAVLRGLAEDPSTGVQVAYATHSPYFIEAKSFHQFRRVTRRLMTDGTRHVSVLGSSVERVIERLSGYLEPETIQRQLDGVCLGGLGEGFFADVVVLAEGSTDRAALTRTFQ